jgi:starch-binding outer membrane protein, SusD/RagB family
MTTYKTSIVEPVLKTIRLIVSMIFLSWAFASCSFLEIDPPKSRVESEVVFSNDITATSAVLGIYAGLYDNSFANGTERGLAMTAGLASDELVNYTKADLTSLEFEDNDLSTENSYILGQWSSMYKAVYEANAVLEGLEKSTGLSDAVKAQLKGESLFVRAFCYFYLVNMFGDVPLALTTDYQVNSFLPRTSRNAVYAQIKKDLVESQGLLSKEYAAALGERIRPNKSTATALMARVHLYLGEWSNAEEQSTKVIQEGMYVLEEDLNDVFTSNSKEAIWQLRPTIEGASGRTFEAYYFAPSNVLKYNVLRKDVISTIEPDDLRGSVWICNLVDNSIIQYYPAKYKQASNSGPLNEYSMVFRLSEQYLIRAEARAKQLKLTGANSAQSDINVIRNRAGLPGTSSTSQEALLADVAHERRIEFMAEWGHRWFDLKRTGQATPVLSVTKEGFESDDELFPIPQSEFLKNPRLGDQNHGY